MFVKTTKGIYELKPNRTLVDYPIIDNGRTMGKTQKMFATKCYIYYGDVVAQSDNLGELIDKCAFIDKERNVRNVYPNKITYPHEIYNNLNVIGMIWCGDDLIKVADWDNEKGEWKLYER
jgi:hypothetical protein